MRRVSYGKCSTIDTRDAKGIWSCLLWQKCNSTETRDIRPNDLLIAAFGTYTCSLINGRLLFYQKHGWQLLLSRLQQKLRFRSFLMCDFAFSKQIHQAWGTVYRITSLDADFRPVQRDSLLTICGGKNPPRKKFPSLRVWTLLRKLCHVSVSFLRSNASSRYALGDCPVNLRKVL